jgi:replication factor C subunit 2/4
MENVDPMELDAPREVAHSHMPWVEKYRPRCLADVSSQREVVNALKSSIDSGNVPHLLFYGPPGTGKTSTIIAMAKELYGEHYNKRVLELNASDERGISVVRDKVKGFASTAVASGSTGGRKLPPFKLIILDECDSMSQDAQSALRRTMEQYTRVTRFCLICNYVSRIIDPLASRCAKFRFDPLPQESFVDKINQVSRAEALQLGDGTMETLVKVSAGDMRAGITYLQASSQFTGKGLIDSQVVLEIAGLPSKAFIKSVWASVRSRKFSELEKCAEELQAEGYSSSSVIKVLQEELIAMDNDEKMTDLKKAKILMKIAEMDHAMIEGASEDLQFKALLSFITKVYHSTSSS